MLERKQRRELLDARNTENLRMLRAQGNERAMEKHLFTSVKYQLKNDDIREN